MSTRSGMFVLPTVLVSKTAPFLVSASVSEVDKLPGWHLEYTADFHGVFVEMEG